MSSQHKEHAKSLKGPDQLQVYMAAILNWLLKNARPLLLFVALPVASVVGVAYGWQKYQSHLRETRVEELGRIQVLYSEENRRAGEEREKIQKDIDAIDAKIRQASEPPKPATGPDAAAAAPVPSAPATPDPKLVSDKAALEKRRDAVRPDHKDSSAKFLDYYRKNEGNPEGWVAGMSAARFTMEEEKYADARPILEAILTKSVANPFYQTQARLAYLGLLEELGEFDKAIAETETLEKGASDDVKPRALLIRGRLQMLKNAQEDAKKTFAALISAHATSPEAQKARSLQALLK